MKLRTKKVLLFIALLSFCSQTPIIAQRSYEDISNGASVFVFRKTVNTPRDAVGSNRTPRDAGAVSQRTRGNERREVIKNSKSTSEVGVTFRPGAKSAPKKVAQKKAEPIAPEEWINEGADLAIEERKIADEEPLLFLSEGYLNSKIQFCESPLFSEGARKAGLKQVRQRISVTIGKYGGVLDAESLEGDAVFRQAVYKSLESMRFRESYFMGQPVRIQGILDLTQKPTIDVVCRVAEKEVEIPTIIDGGVLNEYAKTCEVPSFPIDAKASLNSVTARIGVIVDEKGTVVNAALIDGHPSFGAAALKAAQKTTFPVSSIIRQPVKVKGVIVFTQTLNNDASCKTAAIK